MTNLSSVLHCWYLFWNSRSAWSSFSKETHFDAKYLICDFALHALHNRIHETLRLSQSPGFDFQEAHINMNCIHWIHKILKGWIKPKYDNCHHLLALFSFPTCMTFFLSSFEHMLVTEQRCVWTKKQWTCNRRCSFTIIRQYIFNLKWQEDE